MKTKRAQMSCHKQTCTFLNYLSKALVGIAVIDGQPFTLKEH